VSQDNVVQEQDHFDELPAAFFLQNVLPLQQQRWVILRVGRLALCKIINVEDSVLIPKKRGEKFSSGFLYWELCGGVSRYASTSFIAAVSPDYSDVTRFIPWSSITTRNYLDRAKEIQNLL
jgi:hypothetical protein